MILLPYNIDYEAKKAMILIEREEQELDITEICEHYESQIEELKNIPTVTDMLKGELG